MDRITSFVPNVKTIKCNSLIIAVALIAVTMQTNSVTDGTSTYQSRVKNPSVVTSLIKEINAVKNPSVQNKSAQKSAMKEIDSTASVTGRKGTSIPNSIGNRSQDLGSSSTRDKTSVQMRQNQPNTSIPRNSVSSGQIQSSGNMRVYECAIAVCRENQAHKKISILACDNQPMFLYSKKRRTEFERLFEKQPKSTNGEPPFPLNIIYFDLALSNDDNLYFWSGDSNIDLEDAKKRIEPDVFKTIDYFQPKRNYRPKMKPCSRTSDVYFKVGKGDLNVLFCTYNEQKSKKADKNTFQIAGKIAAKALYPLDKKVESVDKDVCLAVVAPAEEQQNKSARKEASFVKNETPSTARSARKEDRQDSIKSINEYKDGFTKKYPSVVPRDERNKIASVKGSVEGEVKPKSTYRPPSVEKSSSKVSSQPVEKSVGYKSQMNYGNRSVEKTTSVKDDFRQSAQKEPSYQMGSIESLANFGGYTEDRSVGRPVSVKKNDSLIGSFDSSMYTAPSVGKDSSTIRIDDKDVNKSVGQSVSSKQNKETEKPASVIKSVTDEKKSIVNPPQSVAKQSVTSPSVKKGDEDQRTSVSKYNTPSVTKTSVLKNSVTSPSVKVNDDDLKTSISKPNPPSVKNVSVTKDSSLIADKSVLDNRSVDKKSLKNLAEDSYFQSSKQTEDFDEYQNDEQGLKEETLAAQNTQKSVKLDDMDQEPQKEASVAKSLLKSQAKIQDSSIQDTTNRSAQKSTQDITNRSAQKDIKEDDEFDDFESFDKKNLEDSYIDDFADDEDFNKELSLSPKRDLNNTESIKKGANSSLLSSIDFNKSAAKDNYPLQDQYESHAFQGLSGMVTNDRYTSAMQRLRLLI